MKLLEVEGARAAVPHSWRRHWEAGFRPGVYCVEALMPEAIMGLELA